MSMSRNERHILTPTSDNRVLSASMPLLLSNRGVENFINHFEHDCKYEELFMRLEVVLNTLWRLIKFISGFYLLQTILITIIHLSNKGLLCGSSERSVPKCGSLYTPIRRTYPEVQAPVQSAVNKVNANERTPLLREGKTYGGTSAALRAASGSDGYGSQSGADSTYGSDNECTGAGGDIEAAAIATGAGKPRRDWCAYFRVMTFVLILAGGCVIATYLLIADSRLPVMQFSLDLVHRDIWSNVSRPLADFLNHTNVMNIVIMQTGGAGCEKIDKCLQILREMQKQYQMTLGNAQEVPFNFLIGGDRQTYEARGWNYESGLNLARQNATLVIAFIGNYTNMAPSTLQLHSALSLIAESVRLKKLQRQYKIYGLRNLTNSQNDGEALFGEIRQWAQYGGLLHVL
ncbi:peptidoglycan-recognition protein LD isoform X1 [Ceratitis capitata]|uniref:peptidoglycan-recognition protein LD isoform X1 n=1 Tax=Ceratitis capitata TaxID=7213 RepID=UPI0006189187|nr:peptidoglycan-recognition protein LD isoform X1 [Ceratitis capitata]